MSPRNSTATAALLVIVAGGSGEPVAWPGLTSHDGAYEPAVADPAVQQPSAAMPGLMPGSAGPTAAAAATSSRYTVGTGDGDGLATAIIDGVNGRLGDARPHVAAGHVTIGRNSGLAARPELITPA